MKKKHFYMWYASVGLLVFDFFAYCEFIMGSKTLAKMIIDIIMLIVGVTLLFYSRKKLTYKEGFTAVQAIQFFRKCTKAGITTKKELRENVEKVAEFAQSSGIKEQSNTADYLNIFEKGRYCYNTFIKK